jgi:hypothetical protein
MIQTLRLSHETREGKEPTMTAEIDRPKSVNVQVFPLGNADRGVIELRIERTSLPALEFLKKTFRIVRRSIGIRLA